MEVIIGGLIDFAINQASNYVWLKTILLSIGAVYLFLTTCRGVLTLIVSKTKTLKDDKIIKAIFAFLDKWSFGFGKVKDYYEDNK